MRFLILTAALTLGACAPQYVAVTEPVCGSMATIWVSKSDRLSEGTSSQIEANNLAREKLCGRSRPPARQDAKGATS